MVVRRGVAKEARISPKIKKALYFSAVSFLIRPMLSCLHDSRQMSLSGPSAFAASPRFAAVGVVRVFGVTVPYAPTRAGKAGKE
jgi:hypothetical protein